MGREVYKWIAVGFPSSEKVIHMSAEPNSNWQVMDTVLANSWVVHSTGWPFVPLPAGHQVQMAIVVHVEDRRGLVCGVADLPAFEEDRGFGGGCRGKGE